VREAAQEFVERDPDRNLQEQIRLRELLLAAQSDLSFFKAFNALAGRSICGPGAEKLRIAVTDNELSATLTNEPDELVKRLFRLDLTPQEFRTVKIDH